MHKVLALVRLLFYFNMGHKNKHTCFVCTEKVYSVQWNKFVVTCLGLNSDCPWDLYFLKCEKSSQHQEDYVQCSAWGWGCVWDLVTLKLRECGELRRLWPAIGLWNGDHSVEAGSSLKSTLFHSLIPSDNELLFALYSNYVSLDGI